MLVAARDPASSSGRLLVGRGRTDLTTGTPGQAPLLGQCRSQRLDLERLRAEDGEHASLAQLGVELDTEVERDLTAAAHRLGARRIGEVHAGGARVEVQEREVAAL